jgi:uncharacterized protein YdaU (DUF1376 family)
MSYLRLIWLYYETETPLPDRPDLLAFKIGGDEKEVALILESYFKRDGDQWRHTRCDKEIHTYHRRSESARNGAKVRWSNAGAMPQHSQSSADAPKSDANQEPRTKNQEPPVKQRERTPTGSRLPADWSLPDDWAEWARQERPDLIPQQTAQRFADYWHGVAGAKGRKADWLATWRNWVRGERATNTSRTATPKVAMPMTFAERDEQARRKRWEEMTGRKWPESGQPETIDITPDVLRIDHEPASQSD